MSKGRKLDERAIQIIESAYWSPAGWRHSLHITSEEFEYAKAAGLMFEPVPPMNHSELVRTALKVVRATDVRDVAQAFIASLKTRRLDQRSAIGSFAVLKHLSAHELQPLQPSHSGDRACAKCAICGGHAVSHTLDLNVLSFERLKWGGVRHDQIEYATFDLQVFHEFESTQDNGEGLRILVSILKTIKSVPSTMTSANLHKVLAPLLKSNKAERDILIGLLGICGILGTADHPGYVRRFICYEERELPERRFVDMPYPACWWKGSDGIQWEAVEYWFPDAVEAAYA